MDVVQAVRAAAEADPGHVGCALAALKLLGMVKAHASARRLSERTAEALRAGPRAVAALLSFATQAPVRVCEHGETVVREGEAGGSAFVLLRGEVYIWRAGLGQVATLRPGDLFGEVALLGHTARTATVIASGPAEVMELPHASLRRLIDYVPEVEAALHRIYYAHLNLLLFPSASCLANLTPEQRGRLLPRFVPCTVPAGTLVLREGQPASGFCVIVSGRVTVWRLAIDQRRDTLAELGPGEFFGEISLLYDVPVTACVEAQATLTFFALRREDFLTFIRDDPVHGRALMQAARGRLGYARDDYGISAEYAGIELDEYDLDVFVSDPLGGAACPHCGFPDAGLTCVACGAQVA